MKSTLVQATLFAATFITFLLISPWLDATKGGAHARTVGNVEHMRLAKLDYFVIGEIRKIENGTYWVQKASGQVVRLTVNSNTNMICPSRAESSPGNTQTASKGTMPGFRIGDCPFRVGERIKAETTDVGTVTLLRYLERDEPSRTERLGLPQNYGDMLLNNP